MLAQSVFCRDDVLLVPAGRDLDFNCLIKIASIVFILSPGPKKANAPDWYQPGQDIICLRAGSPEPTVCFRSCDLFPKIARPLFCYVLAQS